MKKYFFDLVSGHRAEYDYKGREFPSIEKAFQLAELIALDLGMGEDAEWSGWTINVRNAHGQQLFSVPVCEAELVAA